jgi:hypothetical protein
VRKPPVLEINWNFLYNESLLWFVRKFQPIPMAVSMRAFLVMIPNNGFQRPLSIQNFLFPPGVGPISNFPMRGPLLPGRRKGDAGHPLLARSQP